MTRIIAARMFAFCALGCFVLFAQKADKPDAVSTAKSRTPAHAFDSARNAAADIEQAIAEAGKIGKRVLLDVGGDWCPWCHLMDQLFEGNPNLLKLRDDNFITVRIYYGAGNKNEQVLSRYSHVLGVPHFFVLEKDGTLLHSQHVIELQTNGNYSADKVKEFLLKWSPGAGDM